MKKSQKILKSLIYTIAIGVIINVFSSYIFSVINNVKFLTAFKEVWTIFFSLIKEILLFDIKVWQILVSLSILSLLLVLLSRLQRRNLSVPEFMKYTSDLYKGINYKWVLESYAGELRITKLQPVCNCGALLTLKNRINNTYYGKEYLYCVNCEKAIKENYDDEVKLDAHLFFINKLNRMIGLHNKKIITCR